MIPRPSATEHRLTAQRGALLPPRTLPLLYFGVARVSLLAAFGVVAMDPRGVAGFFYHARMVAVVHLITLGWITCSILGALYIVGPLALRTALPARRGDYVAFGLMVFGIAGMVAHFWIGEARGMAWSALAVVPALVHVGQRVIRALRPAPVQPAVKLHIVLAFGNVLAAAAMGLLIAFDKVYHFLQGFVLTNVYAHAHLAAVGWALMMAVGIAYRLLPMILPGAMPHGRGLMASALLFEAGAVGLFVNLLMGGPASGIFAVVIVAGIGAFVREAIGILRHPRPAPRARPRPDYGALQALGAIASLVVAATLGLVLAFAPTTEWSLRVALAYGVFGLVGFFAQLIAGIESRLLPLHAWYWAFALTGPRDPIPVPDAMPLGWAQRWSFYLWTGGVPALAAGLALNAVPFVSAGAWVLLGATAIGGLDATVIARYAYRRCRISGSP